MIEQLSVHHYRSLGHVETDLGSITVLVGPNGSGKSNVVDALRFFRDLAAHGLEHAIDQRGGVGIIRQYAPRRQYVMQFGVQIATPPNVAEHTKQLVDSYLLRVSGTRATARIAQEDVNWSRAEDLWLEDEDSVEFVQKYYTVKVKRDSAGQVEISDSSVAKKAQSRRPLADTEVVLGKASSALEPDYYSIGSPIVSFLRRMRFASVYPNIMREPRRLETDIHLKEDCSNWGSVIRQMRDRRAGQRSLNRVLELMRLVLPELNTIQVKNLGGYVVPQFKVSRAGGRPSHLLDPIQLSDGTLRLFGLLLHLYQEPRPTLLAIEEPEQTIHPALLEVLVSAIREASQTTQLVITTHSPHLLDYFDVDSIRVTALVDGESTLSRIRESQMETVKEGLMRLSEIMALDGLKPDRQRD